MNSQTADPEDDEDDRAQKQAVGAGFVAYPLDEAIADAHDPKPGTSTRDDPKHPLDRTRDFPTDDFDWNNLPGHTDDLEERRLRLLEELDSINIQLASQATGATEPTATQPLSSYNPATGTTATKATATTTQPTATARAAQPHSQGDTPPASVSTGSQLATATPQETVSLTSAHARSPAAAPPETVADSLRGLPQWQQRFVLALMELGGITALACKRVEVSRQTIEKYQALSPDFRKACAAAVDHSTDLVEAAIFKGATIGDLEPKFQGGIRVGFVRKRSTQDAKLMLELRGRLGEGAEATARGASAVATVAPESVPAIVAAVAARLFAANKGRPVKTINADTGKVESD